MKRILTYLFLFVSVTTIFAQSTAKTDAHYNGQTTVIRIDGSAPSGWVKGDNEGSIANTTPVTGNENVNFSSTAEGIFINILNGTNKIKLFCSHRSAPVEWRFKSRTLVYSNPKRNLFSENKQ